MSTNDDVDNVVMRYLEKHPFGADTLEGITEFWLEQRRIRQAVETVGGALERLLDSGSIERVEHGGTTLFRLTTRESKRGSDGA